MPAYGEAVRRKVPISTHGTVESGRVLETWRDGWTYCKATAKALDRHQWVPWLSAAAAAASAITGTAVFATLQQDQVSTLARVVVGSVAAVTAVIAAVQGWAASRVRALTEQAQQFHSFHRDVARDIERLERDATPLGETYADDIDKKLESITAGMIHVGNWAWDKAKAEVESDMRHLYHIDVGDSPRS